MADRDLRCEAFERSGLPQDVAHRESFYKGWLAAHKAGEKWELRERALREKLAKQLSTIEDEDGDWQVVYQNEKQQTIRCNSTHIPPMALAQIRGMIIDFTLAALRAASKQETSGSSITNAPISSLPGDSKTSS